MDDRQKSTIEHLKKLRGSARNKTPKTTKKETAPLAKKVKVTDDARDAANRAAVAKTRELFVPEGGAAEQRIKMALPRPDPRRGGMPLPMSKPIIERGPVTGRTQGMDDFQSRRSFNNPGMMDTYGNPITRNDIRSITPASDRQQAIPNFGMMSNAVDQAIDPKQMTARGAAVRNYGETPRPREYSSFGEFLKTMGLGK